MNPTLVQMTRPGSDHAVAMIYATVTGRAGPWFFIQRADATPPCAPRALRADSCLIEPACGDTVLVCAADAPASSYIVAVLVRAAQASAALVLPGDVSLHTEAGALRVEAARIDLHASRRVELEAPEIGLSGLRGEIRFARFDAAIQQLHAGVGTVRTFAHKVTHTVGRLIVRARDSLRWVDDTDETRAGRVRMQVDERFHLSARHATVLAEGQVKIDASKIDLG
ncbi:uncharacterized protein DUF3540 [Paraburkholderia caballeronis]|uniref:DUF3540 domain-containing protein n=1 Tax=Paraburkholderia caballeronis TaxID=416943 RepID=UPI001065570B|nr:DUF3540 domain-containing protein [Paraburkholderia caballeronis]TDV28729.1 uncharacterized protein DUF3540 [Paraburkholderia caballeronis]